MNSDKYEDYFSLNLIAAEPYCKPVLWIEDVHNHKYKRNVLHGEVVQIPSPSFI